MIKIIRNNTIETCNILDKQLAPDESYQISPNYFLKASDCVQRPDSDLAININNGNFIVNDGVVDLSPELGIRHLTRITPAPIVAITLIHGGHPANDEVISYTESINQWILVPVKSVWTSWTWINDINNRTFELIFYKNGLETENIIHTYSIENSASTGGFENNVNIIFEAGDVIKIKHFDGVTPPENMVCIFYVEVY